MHTVQRRAQQGARPAASGEAPSPGVRVAVVYHSGHGHTGRQAEAVRAGVQQVEGAEVLLLTVEEAQARWGDLASADAIVFGAPTYMASASAAFKAFQEASSRAVMARGFGWKDKVAAGFTNSGSRSGDKLATLIQIALFAAQHGMHWVNLGLPPANNSTKGSEEDLNRLGFWLGAGAQSNVDQGPDVAPPEADLRTAEHLGRRVAEVARQLVCGRVVLGGGGVRGCRPPARRG
ncbi:flavodoxin family protein [Sorangium sp. So ce394]